uniref:Uncharacterized protein n=1 Tax=Arundo donax TaxID=35708 RepID=A0A0A9GW10_ARUDO
MPCGAARGSSTSAPPRAAPAAPQRQPRLCGGRGICALLYLPWDRLPADGGGVGRDAITAMEGIEAVGTRAEWGGWRTHGDRSVQAMVPPAGTLHSRRPSVPSPLHQHGS